MEPLYIRMSHCHCSMYIKAHAAPFAAYLVVAPKQFGFTTGEGKIAAYASSPGFTRQFCSTCCSVMPAGCLDDDPERSAADHYYYASNTPWHEIVDDLPEYDKRLG